MERRIEISLGFWAVVCLMAWVDWKICLLFLAASVWHELGHMLVMVLLRVPVQGVSVSAAGAVLHGRIRTYRQELLCAAAGPVSSFLLTLLTMRIAPMLAIVSGLLGLVNLLPLYPLDGGRVLRACLLLYWEDRAERILSSVTFVTCCLLMIGACTLTACLQAGIWPIFAALAVLWRVGEAQRSENEKPVAFPDDCR